MKCLCTLTLIGWAALKIFSQQQTFFSVQSLLPSKRMEKGVNLGIPWVTAGIPEACRGLPEAAQLKKSASRHSIERRLHRPFAKSRPNSYLDKKPNRLCRILSLSCLNFEPRVLTNQIHFGY